MKFVLLASALTSAFLLASCGGAPQKPSYGYVTQTSVEPGFCTARFRRAPARSGPVEVSVFPKIDQDATEPSIFKNSLRRMYERCQAWKPGDRIENVYKTPPQYGYVVEQATTKDGLCTVRFRRNNTGSKASTEIRQVRAAFATQNDDLPTIARAQRFKRCQVMRQGDSFSLYDY